MTFGIHHTADTVQLTNDKQQLNPPLEDIPKNRNIASVLCTTYYLKQHELRGPQTLGSEFFYESVKQI